MLKVTPLRALLKVPLLRALPNEPVARVLLPALSEPTLRAPPVLNAPMLRVLTLALLTLPLAANLLVLRAELKLPALRALPKLLVVWFVVVMVLGVVPLLSVLGDVVPP